MSISGNSHKQRFITLLALTCLCLLSFSQESVSKQKYTPSELTRQAKAGKTEAQYLLAYRYEMGRSLPRDITKAIHWYRKAARKNHADAQYRVGILYYRQKRYKKARYWLAKRAKAGHADSQYYFANTFRYALGTKEQTSRARKWYTKAAKQGHAKAQYELALLYQNGIGARKSPKLANIWFQRAAKNGDKRAIKQSGKTFASKKNRPAKSPGNIPPISLPTSREQQYELGMRYLLGYQSDIHPQQAIYWLYKAAEQNHPLAQYQLANQYLNGKFVKKDILQAIQYFSKAARQKVAAANTALKYLSKNGFRSSVEAASRQRR
ncbi:MAG TPA: sel1 repeat family protein [Gammaproteobacteria bacterium]|nr:sel1 repeat family protein [Gammaproteobacteria bacterium]